MMIEAIIKHCRVSNFIIIRQNRNSIIITSTIHTKIFLINELVIRETSLIIYFFTIVVDLSLPDAKS